MVYVQFSCDFVYESNAEISFVYIVATKDNIVFDKRILLRMTAHV